MRTNIQVHRIPNDHLYKVHYINLKLPMDREYQRPDETLMAELEEKARTAPPAVPDQCLPTAEYL